MAIGGRQFGDDRNPSPGSSNQTGNTSPKFPWSNSPIGRFARIAALMCAYHWGTTDEEMARSHKFPPAQDLYDLFIRLCPWFALHYNTYRRQKAKQKGYTGPLEIFNAGDVEGRVRYCFARPGRKGHSARSRLYGISVEHPSSVEQQKVGGRREVFARCSKEIQYRLAMGYSVSMEEATEWGK